MNCTNDINCCGERTGSWAALIAQGKILERSQDLNTQKEDCTQVSLQMLRDQKNNKSKGCKQGKAEMSNKMIRHSQQSAITEQWKIRPPGQ